MGGRRFFVITIDYPGIVPTRQVFIILCIKNQNGGIYIHICISLPLFKARDEIVSNAANCVNPKPAVRFRKDYNFILKCHIQKLIPQGITLVR
jgi:hypothetical protein